MASPVAFSASATAASATLVVNEVYGGGANSGATLKNDFIELANAGGSAASVDGWSVQYEPSSGTSATSGTVALVDNTTALTCQSAAACAADSDIIDLIGYGTALIHEGAAGAAVERLARCVSTTSRARPGCPRRTARASRTCRAS
jgi:hypothetical protein